MPLLNFKARFADDVESGRKRQTIRARRKDGRDPKVGDTLYLYTGCRTRQARKLGEGICLVAEPLDIRRLHLAWLTSNPGEEWPGTVHRNGMSLNLRQVLDIARRDGFESVDAFVKFFEETHGLPFEGFMIRWRARG
jgi:hypothetical protein